MSPTDIQQCLQDPQSLLVSAAVNKNMSQFKSALLNGADQDIIDKHTNLSVLHALCKEKGTRPFIEECIKNGSNMTQPNGNGKYPIHFAAESLDPGNLESILLALKEQNPSMMNAKCYNLTAVMQIATAMTKENVEECCQCISLLIENGVDVNIPDNREQTLVLLMLKKMSYDENRIKGILEMMLKKCSVDLDSYRKGEARKLLKQKWPEMETLVQGSNELTIEVLMSHIKSGRYTDFIDGLKTLMNSKGYKSVEELEANNICSATLLETAVIEQQSRIVQHLLISGANANRFKLGTMPPLQLAAQRKLPEIMELILKAPGIQLSKDSDAKSEPILCTIIKQLGEDTEKIEPYRRCFDLLIDREDIDVNEKDNVTGNTPLHFACRYRNRYAIRRLLEKNAYIGMENILKSIAIDDVDPKVLEQYFDSCIQPNHHRLGDDDFELSANYHCFVPPDALQEKGSKKFQEEMLPIVYIAKCKELRYLMTHPLITSFLFIKWHRLFGMFLLNLILYSIFCASLIVYVVFFYGRAYENRALAIIFWMLTIAGVLFLIIREFLQCLLNPWNYTRDLINYLELALIFATFVLLSTSPASYQEFGNMHRVIASITILFAAAELSLLISTLPNSFISTHIVMLKRVSCSFLKSLSINSIILLAFAFCFYTLFNAPTGEKPNNASTDTSSETQADDFNRFIDPGTAIIKTIVMLTGEFEAANIDFNVNQTSYLIFLMFVFFMSIVLFNLLNGLAVSDTQQIKSEAEQCHFSEKAFTLHRFEKSLVAKHLGLLPGIDKNSEIAKWFMNVICVFPGFLPQFKIIVVANQGQKILVPTQKMMVDANGTETMVLMEDMSGASELDRKELSELSKRCCCFLPCYGTCSRMDRKIVKRMHQILAKREIERLEEKERTSVEQRLERIEEKLETLFKMMTEMVKTK